MQRNTPALLFSVIGVCHGALLTPLRLLSPSAFANRGTASKRQMEANLKYTQRAISFGDLTTSTLDHLDGLTIKPCK